MSYKIGPRYNDIRLYQQKHSQSKAGQYNGC